MLHRVGYAFWQAYATATSLHGQYESGKTGRTEVDKLLDVLLNCGINYAPVAASELPSNGMLGSAARYS